MSPSSIPHAVLGLDYPLFACDFDPHDPNTLIVGGGGGSSRSGVGNKISVLDASRRDALHLAGELALSKDEDSASSLAVGPRKGKTTLVLAGVNSGAADVAKGKNEHFRVFAVEPASSKAKAKAKEAGEGAATAADYKISEVSRASLFQPGEATYQRLVRVSPPFEGSSRQVGAAASALGKAGEIAVFDVHTTSANAIKSRGTLHFKDDVDDMDIIQVGVDQWQLAFCDQNSLYSVDITKNSISELRCIYTIPEDVATGSKVRPTFRTLRYLTPSFILCALNFPNSKGVLLQGFRMPQTAHDKARIAVNERVNRTVVRATGMEVRNLSPPSSPSAKQGETQFIVALNGHPNSITLYTLEYKTIADVELLVNLHPITTLKDVHPAPVSGLAFSQIVPPPKGGQSTPATLRLASVGSFGRTVAVHSLPLQKFVDKTAPARRGGPPRPVRYVSALKGSAPVPTGMLIAFAIIVAVLGILVQGFMELKGISGPIIGARSVTPVSWHNDLRKVPRVKTGGTGGFLAEHIASLGEGSVVVVNSDADGVKVDAHDAERHGQAKEWDALPPAQKKAWKEHLKEAGHWAEGMGETVFKGILFGEIAGIVAGVVGG